MIMVINLESYQYFKINLAKNKFNIYTDKIASLSTLRLLHKQATYIGLLHVGSYVWYVTVIISDNSSLFLFLSFTFSILKVLFTFSFQFDTLITSHMKCMRWEVTKSKSKVSMRCPFYCLLLNLFVPSISYWKYGFTRRIYLMNHYLGYQGQDEDEMLETWQVEGLRWDFY